MRRDVRETLVGVLKLNFIAMARPKEIQIGTAKRHWNGTSGHALATRHEMEALDLSGSGLVPTK